MQWFFDHCSCSSTSCSRSLPLSLITFPVWQDGCISEQKSSKLLFLLTYWKNVTTTDLNLDESIIRSTLEYCAHVWHGNLTNDQPHNTSNPNYVIVILNPWIPGEKICVLMLLRRWFTPVINLSEEYKDITCKTTSNARFFNFLCRTATSCGIYKFNDSFYRGVAKSPCFKSWILNLIP